MILQALKEYYDRKTADPKSRIAPEGWESKEIPFVVVLKENGELAHIDDTREEEGNKKRGKLFLVPQGMKKTAGIAANLLWETANYVFGVGDARGEKQKECFISRIREEIPDSTRKQALLAFLTGDNTVLLEKEPYWSNILEKKPNISFRFDNENEFELYCQSDEVKNALSKMTKEPDGLCLVSGEYDKISVLHTAIKGVWGAQSSGANIVSFNKDAFCSWGKRGKQGLNAPVGERAMFAYTTALNTLLGRASNQRMQIGDASTVFWSAQKTQFEGVFLNFFCEPSKDDPDDLDARTECIKTLFNSPKEGGYVDDSGEERFYILGLAPNAARISIRFWKQGTVGEFARHIRRHFEDLDIVKPESEPLYYSLWRLLVNAAIQDRSENIPPNIAGDFMRTILDGTPYPATLLQLVLRRIKSDTKDRVKPVRAALLKAYLNRRLRADEHYNEEEIIQVALNKEYPLAAYHLGRLFAVLEKIQEEAKPGLNATIRERYYGAACGSPVMVFPTLLRLKNHHIAELHKGRAINLELLIGEIVGHIDEFPSHLTLHEQGVFAVGYYHQRQALFTSQKHKESEGAAKTAEVPYEPDLFPSDPDLFTLQETKE